MYSVWVIAKREIKGMFSSPMAYVAIGIFALMMGDTFVRLLEFFDMQLSRAEVQANLMKNTEALAYINLNGLVVMNLSRYCFGLLAFLVPLLSMGLLSEEKNRGTYELLLTSPVSAFEIALGKYLAATIFLLLMLSTHLLPLFIMFVYGNPEVLPVVSAYLGLFLGGLVFVAAGLFASSLTRVYLIAGIIAIAINLLFMRLADAAGTESGNLAIFFKSASLFSHFDNFNNGLITVSSLVYIATLIVFFVSATTIVIQAQARS